MKQTCSIIMLAVMINTLSMHASEERSVSSGNELLALLSSNTDTDTTCSQAQALIKQGCSVNSVNSKGNAPLYYASQRGYVDVVSALLEAGADVHFNNERMKGVTALFIAAEAGKDGVVDQLLQAGARQDTVTEETAVSPLHIASQKGSAEVVRVLLQHSKKGVDACTKPGATSLWLAAFGGHAGVTEQLIAAGSNLNARSDSGDSSVELAVKRGHTPVVKQLVDAGADLTGIYPFEEENDELHFVGLLWKAIEGGHLDMANILYKEGNGVPVIVPVNWESLLRIKGHPREYIDEAKKLCSQPSPLHKAVMNGDMKQAEQWVYKVDFDSRDAEGRNCFEIPGDDKVKAFLLRAFQFQAINEEKRYLEKCLESISTESLQ